MPKDPQATFRSATSHGDLNHKKLGDGVAIGHGGVQKA